MVQYWFHAYLPEKFVDAQRTGNKEAYFNKRKPEMPQSEDVLVCYIAADPETYKSKYRKFWGTLKVLTDPRVINEKIWISTQPILTLKDPSLGIRFDDQKIWSIIRQGLKIKNRQAWGTFVQREPCKLPDNIGKIIQEELEKIEKYQ